MGTKEKLPLFCLPVVSGLVLSVGLDSLMFVWLVFIGLLPLFVFISRAKNKKMAFLGGWLGGFVFFLLNLKWFLAAYPPVWAGIEDTRAIFIGFCVVWLGSALVLGLSFAFFSLALVWFKGSANKFFQNKKLIVLFAFLARLQRGSLRVSRFALPAILRGTMPASRSKPAKSTISFSLLLTPSLWIIFEYLRAWFFSVWSWGPESSLGPYWTFGHLGYALVNTPAGVWARYIGLYGLSFLVVFINVLLFRLFFFKNKSFKKEVLFFAGVLFFIFIFVPLAAPRYFSDKLIRVDVLQTKIPPFFYYNAFSKLLKEKPLPENISDLPHIIVFPEGSNLFSRITEQTQALLSSLFDQKEKGLIITSTVLKEGDSRYESVVYRDQHGNLLETQKKSFLIPAGEYLPYVVKIPLEFLGRNDAIGIFNNLRHYNRGREGERPVFFADIKLGTLLCSGVLSPVFYRHLAKEGAEVLVNSASHSVLGFSEQAFGQIKTFSRFQAIANSRPFLQSAGNGYGFIIDANGKFTAGDFSVGNKFISGEVAVVKKETLYTKFGDWFLWVGFVIVFVGFWRRLGYNKKYEKSIKEN